MCDRSDGSDQTDPTDGENPLKRLYETYVAANEEIYEQAAWSRFEELTNLDRDVWRRVFICAAEICMEKLNEAKQKGLGEIRVTGLEDVNLSNGLAGGDLIATTEPEEPARVLAQCRRCLKFFDELADDWPRCNECKFLPIDGGGEG